MNSLIKTVGLAQGLRLEFPPFLIALIVAQVFFKWGSFALELLGFIAVWWVVGFILDRLLPNR